MKGQLTIAVRITAAALAGFMTIALLNGIVSIAEPQQSQLMARNTARRVAEQASAPRGTVTVVSGPVSTLEH